VRFRDLNPNDRRLTSFSVRGRREAKQRKGPTRRAKAAEPRPFVTHSQYSCPLKTKQRREGAGFVTATRRARQASAPRGAIRVTTTGGASTRNSNCSAEALLAEGVSGVKLMRQPPPDCKETTIWLAHPGHSNARGTRQEYSADFAPAAIDRSASNAIAIVRALTAEAQGPAVIRNTDCH
jgi:hypothetical protein